MAASSDSLFNLVGETEVKAAYVIICLITSGISFCLFVALIYYEMNIDRYRMTLINKIYSLLVSYVVATLILLNINDIGKALYGPLPPLMCKFIMAGLQGFFTATCASLIEVIVVKYMYCCVLNSLGGFNEDLYFIYFVFLNGLIIIYMSCVTLYSGIVSPGTIAKCCGCNPEMVMQQIYHSDLPFAMYILWLVLVIHIVLQWKIRKIETSLSTNRPSTIKSILMSWMNIIVLSFFTSFFTIVLLLLDPDKYEDTTNNNLHWVRPMSNIVLGFCIIAYSYYTHPHIRNVIRKYCVCMPSRTAHIIEV